MDGPRHRDQGSGHIGVEKGGERDNGTGVGEGAPEEEEVPGKARVSTGDEPHPREVHRGTEREVKEG